MSTKHDLLEAEDKAWHELSARFEAVPPDRFEEPGAAGDWCAKDVMAHVACWHAQLTDWLEAFRVAGEKPGEIDFQGMNEKFHGECEGLTVRDVRAMSGASRHRMREELALIDDGISDGWKRLIATCLHDHYAEHLEDLDALIGGKA